MENKFEVTKEKYTQSSPEISLDGEDEHSPCQLLKKPMQKVMCKLAKNHSLLEYNDVEGGANAKQ